MGVAVAGLAVALPARAVELIDEVYKEDFDVQFWGQTMDHKFIIYAIVLGQFVGFAGATVSGLEAKKRKEEVLQLNAKLLGINKELRKLAREGGFVSSSLEVRKEGKESKQVEESREHVISMLRQGKELLRQTDAQVCLAASLRGPALLIYTSFRVSRVHVCGRGYSHSVTSRRLLLF